MRAYRCGDKSAGGCNGTTIVAKPVESLVAEAVLHVLEKSPAVSTALAKPIRGNDDVEGDDLGSLEHDLAALAEDFGTGRITRGEWLAAREPLERRRGVALAAVESSIDTAPLLVFGRGSDVHAQWEALTLDQRRAVIRALIDNVEIAPATQGTNAFDRDRVKPHWRA